MPRLTISTYIAQHYQLKQLWRDDPQRFSYLCPRDQLVLHMFYLFGLEKSDQELTDHRKAVKLHDSALPQRAGKAYVKLMQRRIEIMRYRYMPSGRAISARPLMRAAPDLRLLSSALLTQATQDDGASRMQTLPARNDSPTVTIDNAAECS